MKRPRLLPGGLGDVLPSGPFEPEGYGVAVRDVMLTVQALLGTGSKERAVSNVGDAIGTKPGTPGAVDSDRTFPVGDATSSSTGATEAGEIAGAVDDATGAGAFDEATGAGAANDAT